MIRKLFSQLRIGDKFFWLPLEQQVPRAIERDVKVGDTTYEGETDKIKLDAHPSTEVWVDE